MDESENCNFPHLCELLAPETEDLSPEHRLLKELWAVAEPAEQRAINNALVKAFQRNYVH